MSRSKSVTPHSVIAALKLRLSLWSKSAGTGDSQLPVNHESLHWQRPAGLEKLESVMYEFDYAWGHQSTE